MMLSYESLTGVVHKEALCNRYMGPTYKYILEDFMNEQTKDNSSLALARLCAQAASDKKANNILILDISKLTSFTDYFVVCSAPSERQVQAIVRNVQDEMRAQNLKPLSIEGLETASWILLDCGNVVFHCFTDVAREYYKLESFWTKAELIDFE